MELFNSINIKRVLSPSAGPSDNTAQVGQVIDHQLYSQAVYAINTGTLADADATFTVLLEESDASGSGFAAVDDADLLGTEALASFVFSDDDKCFKLGYKGKKRYTRLTITPAANTGAAPMSAMCLLVPRLKPSSNPPA